MKRASLASLALLLGSALGHAQSAAPDSARWFDYDRKQPLHIQEKAAYDRNGVRVVDLTYASPRQGRVTAFRTLLDRAKWLEKQIGLKSLGPVLEKQLQRPPSQGCAGREAQSAARPTQFVLPRGQMVAFPGEAVVEPCYTSWPVPAGGPRRSS